MSHKLAFSSLSSLIGKGRSGRVCDLTSDGDPTSLFAFARDIFEDGVHFLQHFALGLWNE